MGASPWRKPFLYARHMSVPTPVAFRTAISNIFPSMCNRKHASRRPRPPNGRADAERLHRASVLRHRAAGGIENRFGERKLQHDLAVVVGHLDDRTQQRAVGAVGLE